MPMLNCYVDDRTFDLLFQYSERSGRAVVELAEAAIAEAAHLSASSPSTANAGEEGHSSCSASPGVGEHLNPANGES